MFKGFIASLLKFFSVSWKAKNCNKINKIEQKALSLVNSFRPTGRKNRRASDSRGKRRGRFFRVIYYLTSESDLSSRRKMVRKSERAKSCEYFFTTLEQLGMLSEIIGWHRVDMSTYESQFLAKGLLKDNYHIKRVSIFRIFSNRLKMPDQVTIIR